MENYIGTKIIKAKAMNLGDYNLHRGWDIPSNEDPARKGYLVEYPDGYQSWSPVEVFEEAHHLTDSMPFGLAIESMRKGLKVARKGWNGKGICVFIVNEASGFKQVGFDGEICDVRLGEHIAIDTTGLQTDNPDAPKSVVPWLASQTDMLAEDWQVVE